jgi:hypothetical protein
MPAYVKRDDALVVIFSRDGVTQEMHAVTSPEHALFIATAILSVRSGLYPGDIIRVEREGDGPDEDPPEVSRSSHYS